MLKSAINEELAALDAWRDAKCASIWTRVSTMDHGGHGCESYNDEDAADLGSGHEGIHDPHCPVEIARKTFFAATDRRRALTAPAEVAPKRWQDDPGIDWTGIER